jgi:hypothetical protein
MAADLHRHGRAAYRYQNALGEELDHRRRLRRHDEVIWLDRSLVAMGGEAKVRERPRQVRPSLADADLIEASSADGDPDVVSLPRVTTEAYVGRTRS